jgi:hypothetical protein
VCVVLDGWEVISTLAKCKISLCLVVSVCDQLKSKIGTCLQYAGKLMISLLVVADNGRHARFSKGGRWALIIFPGPYHTVLYVGQIRMHCFVVCEARGGPGDAAEGREARTQTRGSVDGRGGV